jgi:hypothetical protein
MILFCIAAIAFLILLQYIQYVSKINFRLLYFTVAVLGMVVDITPFERQSILSHSTKAVLKAARSVMDLTVYFAESKRRP